MYKGKRLVLRDLITGKMSNTELLGHCVNACAYTSEVHSVEKLINACEEYVAGGKNSSQLLQAIAYISDDALMNWPSVDCIGFDSGWNASGEYLVNELVLSYYKISY